MATFFFASIVVILSILGLSLGLILNNKPLEGSCGGMSNLDSDLECIYVAVIQTNVLSN